MPGVMVPGNSFRNELPRDNQTGARPAAMNSKTARGGRAARIHDCASLSQVAQGACSSGESRRPPKIARVTRVPECSAFGCG